MKKTSRLLQILLLAFLTLTHLRATAGDGLMSWYMDVGNLKPIPTDYSGVINITDPPISCPTNGVDAYSYITNAIGLSTNKGIVYVPKGLYYSSKSILIGSQGPSYMDKKFIIRGDGMNKTAILFTNSTGPAFYCRPSSGGLGSPSPILSGATQGSIAVTLSSSSGYATNDMVMVCNKTNDTTVIWGWFGVELATDQQVTARITNIIGATLYIDAPVPEDLTFNPVVYRWNGYTEGVGFEDFSVSMTNRNTGTEVGLVSLYHGLNCWVKGVKGTNHWNRGFVAQASVGTMVEQNSFGDAENNNSSCYAIQITDRCSMTRIHDNIVRRSSSGILVQGGSVYTDITYNFCEETMPADWSAFGDCLAAGINLHGEAPQHTRIVGNTTGLIYIDQVYGLSRKTTIANNLCTRKDPVFNVPDLANSCISGVRIDYTNRLTQMFQNVIGWPDEFGSGKQDIPLGQGDGTRTSASVYDTIATNSTNLRQVYTWRYENNTLFTANGDTATNLPACLVYGNTPPKIGGAPWPEGIPFPPVLAFPLRTNMIPAYYRSKGLAYPTVSTPPPSLVPTALPANRFIPQYGIRNKNAL